MFQLWSHIYAHYWYNANTNKRVQFISCKLSFILDAFACLLNSTQPSKHGEHIYV